MFYIKEEANVSVAVENIDGNIVLKLNGEEVAYFDNTGLRLLPDCNYTKSLPKSILDEAGYLNIIK